MVLYYLKIAYRNLINNKIRTTIAIIGLAVGICLFSFCLYLVRYKFDKIKQIPRYEQIGTLSAEGKSIWKGGFDLPEIKRLFDANISGIKSICAFRPWINDIYMFQQTGNTESSFFVYTAYADSAFFRVFSLNLTHGSVKNIFSLPNSVVLTEKLAQKIYADTDPIGKTVKRGDEIFTIRGIVKDLEASNPDGESEMIHCVLPEDKIECALAPYLLTDGTSPEKINQYLKESGFYFNEGEKLLPKIEMIADKKMQQEDYAVMLVGALVLLTGLINYFSFSIGMFYNRAKSLLLQVCLGAGSKQLFALIFVELSLFMALATFVSYCLCEIGAPMIFDRMNQVSNNAFHFDLDLFFFHQLQYFAALMIVIAIISALAVRKLMQNPVMRGLRGGWINVGKHTLRNVMLGLQFFICFLFLGFASIMQMQFNKLQNNMFSSFPQEEQQRTFVVPLDLPQLIGLEDQVCRELAESGAVEEIMTAAVPIQNSEEHIFWADSVNRIHFAVVEASSNFAAFIGLPMLQGEIPDSRQTVVVSRDIALFLDKNGHNGHISINNKDYPVSGVVESTSVRMKNSHSNLIIRIPNKPQYCYIKSVGGKEKEVLQHITATLKKRIPDTLDLQITTFDKSIIAEAEIIPILLNILSLMTLVCIIMVSMGVFAAITLDTEHKQKEVAIRKINGATFTDIVMLFSKLYVKLLSGSFIVALPLLWISSSFLLSHFAYRINVNNPLLWAGLLLSVFIMVTLIVFYRLVWIARLNPAKVIKSGE